MTNPDAGLGGLANFLLSKIYVEHSVWSQSETEFDSHGNPIDTYAEPVQRLIMAAYPISWATPEADVISADYANRYVFNLEMLVPDASVYKKRDHVTFNGLVYEVQDLAWNWPTGLPAVFGDYQNFIGGSVHIRRVT